LLWRGSAKKAIKTISYYITIKLVNFTSRIMLLTETKESKKHFTKKWEVSLIEFQNGEDKKYKVTRRIPELSIAETKLFRDKKLAKKQFDSWLD